MGQLRTVLCVPKDMPFQLTFLLRRVQKFPSLPFSTNAQRWNDVCISNFTLTKQASAISPLIVNCGGSIGWGSSVCVQKYILCNLLWWAMSISTLNQIKHFFIRILLDELNSPFLYRNRWLLHRQYCTYPVANGRASWAIGKRKVPMMCFR